MENNEINYKLILKSYEQLKEIIEDYLISLLNPKKTTYAKISYQRKEIKRAYAKLRNLTNIYYFTKNGKAINGHPIKEIIESLEEKK